ncbi:MAG: PLP-dependent aminotransferase family protein [Firmicutes bacterium]|nr:PLP-dependent aminotransferase family protein [Bacillota bacterium]
MSEPMKGTGTKIVIEWMPDKNSSIPLYQQIVDYISGKIAAGDYAAGVQLPSQRDMAMQFGVNRSTIVTAMEELMSYGLIESHSSHGTRVADMLWSPKHRQQPPNWSHYVKQGVVPANSITMQRLNHYEASPDIMQFSTDQLSFDVFPTKMLETVMNKVAAQKPDLSYLQPQGLPELRKILAKRLAYHRNIHVPESCILLTTGLVQTMILIRNCLLKPGSSIFTEEYSWLYSYPRQTTGMKVRSVPMDSEGLCYWQMPLNRETDSSPLVYTMPNYHNPTTLTMSAERRRQLLGFCQNRQLPIIENDIYGNLWLDAPPPPTIKSLDESGTVLYVSALNKELSPALGMAYMVAPESVVERLADMKRQTSDMLSFYAQWMLVRMLDDHTFDDYLAYVRSRLQERRDKMLHLLDKYFSDLATWTVPQGGYFIWLEFEDDLPVEQLFEKALLNNILICPGTLFSPDKNHCLRLSFSYIPEKDMERGLKTLAELTLQLKKHF